MAKLLITTQVYENYAWNEDGSIGTGENAYWKAKGGSDYVIKNFRDYNRVTETVMAMRGQIEQDSEYFREQIIGWEVVADDYLTDFERSQWEYEGVIRFPAKEIQFA
jgi:hypothetical protein